MPATIFVTAHEQYALRAFEVNAVDYLLKPFDADRFRRSVERARQHLVERAAADEPLPILHAVEAPEYLSRRRPSTGQTDPNH
jgi:two-component system LytT family response regulator